MNIRALCLPPRSKLSTPSIADRARRNEVKAGSLWFVVDRPLRQTIKTRAEPLVPPY